MAIIDSKADYPLSVKGNRTALHYNAGATVSIMTELCLKVPHRDGGKAVDKRVLCKQNPKQELYKEVQFLPL